MFTTVKSFVSNPTTKFVAKETVKTVVACVVIAVTVSIAKEAGEGAVDGIKAIVETIKN